MKLVVLKRWCGPVTCLTTIWHYFSGLATKRVMREALTGMAMRKKGITEKHYLSPLNVDGGRK